MLFLFGVFLWMVALLTLYAVLLPVIRQTSWKAVCSGGLLLLAIWGFFYSVPREDVLGGDDPAAYLGTAFWFLEADHFVYDHPLWKLLEPEQRDLFYYRGQGTEVKTLHHIMRVQGEEEGIIAPWFQVSFPLMISVPGRWGGPWAALWTAPILAWMGALGFAGFCWTLWGRGRAFLLGGILFLCNPLLIWHGCILRSELPALFFLWSGLSLFLRFWDSDAKRSGCGLVFSAVVICMSGFFHATGWWMPLSLCVWLIPSLLRGKPRAWLFTGGCWVMGWLFLFQMARISNIYNIRELSSRILSLAWVIHLGLLMGLGIWFRWIAPTLFKERKPLSPRLQLVVPLILLIVGLLGLQTKGLPFPLRLFSVSDLKGFTYLLGVLPVLISCVGLVGLLVGKNAVLRSLSVPLLGCLLPGVLLSHVIPNYMYGSRYFLIYIVPLYTLGVLVWIMKTPTFHMPSWVMETALVFAFIFGGFFGNRLLLQVKPDQGLISFLRQPAELIQEEEGMLLVEYSRLSTPFSSLFGIPTLGVDNEYQLESAPVSAAWAGLMDQHPERASFFMTPFSGEPRSPFFRFEKVWEGVYETEHLTGSYPRSPSTTRPWRLRPRLYRMERIVEETALRDPGTLTFSESNMGRSGFGKVQAKPAQHLSGVILDASNSLQLVVPAEHELFLFGFKTDGRSASDIDIKSLEGTAYTIAPIFLPGSWLLYRFPAHSNERSLVISSREPIFLYQANSVDSSGHYRFLDLPAEKTVEQVPEGFVARWAHLQPRLELPGVEGGEGFVLLYATAPGELPQPSAVHFEVGGVRVDREMRPGQWQWLIFPYTPAKRGDQWMSWRTDRPLQPGNLSLLVGYGATVNL